MHNYAVREVKLKNGDKQEIGLRNLYIHTQKLVLAFIMEGIDVFNEQ